MKRTKTKSIKKLCDGGSNFQKKLRVGRLFNSVEGDIQLYIGHPS